MAIDSGRHARLGRIALVVVAAAPPLAGAAGLWDWVRSHPLPALLVLACYELLVGLAAVAGAAYGELSRQWSTGFAEAAGTAMRRQVSLYGRRYRRFLAQLHQDVELSGPGAHPLERVYVDLTLVTDPPDAERGTVWGFLHAHRALAIVGPPGSGKTTLLKHMTRVLARGRAAWRPDAPRHKTPILLYLRDHAAGIAADPEITLPHVVRSSLRTFGAAEPPRWFERQLGTGRCVVLLDGLDEIARQEDRRLVVDWVEQQIALYPGNRFALTSRPHGYGAHPLKTATVLRVRPFTPGQITRFAHGWHLAGEHRGAGRPDDGARLRARDGADDLVRRLRAAPALLELASSPLPLTMLAHLHRRLGALPGGRIELHRELCRAFLGARPAAGAVVDDLTVEQKEAVLRVLALHLMERHARELPVTEAADVIAPALASVRPQMDAMDFLRSVEQGSGLLLERANGCYCFAHQTLQEYLAAACILETGHVDLLVRNIGRSWWRETTLLYAALADATPLVAACLRAGDGDHAVRELAFAADVADVAGRLAPECRDLLDTALGRIGKQGHALCVARQVRRVARLRDDLVVVREPLSAEDYARFRSDAGGRPGHRAPSTLTADGWTYRLPSPAEAEEILDAGLIDPARFTLVTDGRTVGGGPGAEVVMLVRE